VVELYRMQLKGGRLLLHEHLHGASSWDLEWMTKLAEEEGVEVSVADQCQYGLRTWGDKRKVKDRPARKRTRFMITSHEIAGELRRKCRGEHKHEHLMGKKAAEAAQYPEGLCKAICRGLIKEERNRVLKVKSLMNIKHDDKVEGGKKAVSHEGEEEDMWTAHDDVTGAVLNPRKVVKARAVELGYIAQKGVWVKMLRSEAQRRGIRIVGTRWFGYKQG